MSKRTLPGEWVFEAADPEVGFLSDYIFHDCADNEDGDPAEQDSSFRKVTRCKPNGEHEKVVAESIKFTCPVCKATTTTVEHWPEWMFEEQPGGDS
jgi:hypothetical protein